MYMVSMEGNANISWKTWPLSFELYGRMGSVALIGCGAHIILQQQKNPFNYLNGFTTMLQIRGAVLDGLLLSLQ